MSNRILSAQREPEVAHKAAILNGPAPIDSINLAGMRISVVNLATATRQVLDLIKSGRKGYVCVRDAHGVVRARKDTELRMIHNRAFMVTPDGMPLVWALRMAGHRQSGRVYGPDLMHELVDRGRDQGVRHFLYGTTTDVLARLEYRLLRRFPGARIVGTYAPPFRELTEEEADDIADRINALGCDIVWVGLSTPKQERWMARMRDRLDAPALVGVGAAFDFHAGMKPQAPAFLQRIGMEWAFRLASEPRRLWRRYAITVPGFIALMVAQKSGIWRFPLDEPPLADPSRPQGD